MLSFVEVGDTLGLAALRLAAKHTHIAITRQARHVAEIANPVAPHANSVAKIAAARPHLDAIEAMQIVPESRVKPEMVTHSSLVDTTAANDQKNRCIYVDIIFAGHRVWFAISHVMPFSLSGVNR